MKSLRSLRWSCFFLWAGILMIHAQEQVSLTFVVETPADVEALFVVGNLPELGQWNPGKVAMTRENGVFKKTVRVRQGEKVQYKFTRGSWAREGLLPDGSVPANHEITADQDQELKHNIQKFREGLTPGSPPKAEGSGVLGTLEYWHDFPSKNLAQKRHIAIWLPPGYAASPNSRYPVLYMHDGQNLFDPRLANTGVDWGVDESVVKLMEQKKIPPIIVVGVFSTVDRVREYNPLTGGGAYAKFLIEELKPAIDAKFRTRPEAKYTGTMGSSAGGLISLGLGWKHPDVFTRIGAVSGHLNPIGSQLRGTGESIIDKIEAAANLDKNLRIYLDSGTKDIDSTYAPHHERFKKLLLGWGWKENENLVVRAFEGTRHTEADWRARLTIPLEFLYGDLKE